MEAVFSAAGQTRTVTLEAYLEQEEQAGQKYVFMNGIVLPVPGKTYDTVLVASNVAIALSMAVQALSGDFPVLGSNMKVMIKKYCYVVYPDALVINGKPAFYQGRQDVITNPLVIVEVLSPSTEGYDMGVKFGYYTTLDSLKEYILIHPKTWEVASWYREAPDLWRKTTTPADQAALKVRALGVSVPMEGIFRGVVA